MAESKNPFNRHHAPIAPIHCIKFENKLSRHLCTMIKICQNQMKNICNLHILAQNTKSVLCTWVPHSNLMAVSILTKIGPSTSEISLDGHIHMHGWTDKWSDRHASFYFKIPLWWEQMGAPVRTNEWWHIPRYR